MRNEGPVWKAIDGLGWTALLFCGMLLIAFFISTAWKEVREWNAAHRASVDCSGCPPGADACLCEVVTPEPPLVERRGWFPCTLSNGVEALCFVGGSTDTLPVPQPDFQAPVSSGPEFGFTWGLRPSTGDVGFGFGYPGYVIMPMGGDYQGGW